MHSRLGHGFSFHQENEILPRKIEELVRPRMPLYSDTIVPLPSEQLEISPIACTNVSRVLVRKLRLESITVVRSLQTARSFICVRKFLAACLSYGVLGMNICFSM